MLSDLFRVRRGKNHGRRSGVAELHGAGRVLPERTAANMDRVVHAALAALVPCGHGVWNIGAGIGAGVDDVSAAALSHSMLLHPHAVADRDHPLGELYVSELFGTGAGLPPAG